MRKLLIGVGLMAIAMGVACNAQAAELSASEHRAFGWQDREYFGVDHSKYQLGGGDSATAGESGDAGSAGAATGATGGESGNSGDACGPK